MRDLFSVWIRLSLLPPVPGTLRARGDGGVDPSPAHWPAGELDELVRLNRDFGRRPSAEADNGLAIGYRDA